MLTLEVPGGESYDEGTGEFLYEEAVNLRLEHSLVAVSKWESKWKKRFLSDGEKTEEETLDYIRCMCLDDVDPGVFGRIGPRQVSEVNAYISDPMTATTFRRSSGGRSGRERVSSELVYYWMASLNIPFECQHWHLNRLLTLIEVFNVKNSKGKKMSSREVSDQYAELNAARKKALNTSG